MPETFTEEDFAPSFTEDDFKEPSPPPQENLAQMMVGPNVNVAQYVAGGGPMAGMALLPPNAHPNPFESYIKIAKVKGESLPGQMGAAALNTASGLVEGIVSPLGVATSALGPIPKLAQAGIGAGFGLPAVKQGLHRVYEGAALQEPQEVMEGALQTLTGGAITLGAASQLLPKATLEAEKAATRTLKQEAQDASKVSETTKVHGDVQPLTGQGEGQVSTQEGGGGVQPQTQGQTPSEVLLKETVPPAVTAGEAPQQAPSVGSADSGEATTSPREPANPESNVAPAEAQDGVDSPVVTPTVTEGGPGVPAGPGAAPIIGEIPVTGEGGDIYGVAERVRLQRAAAGQTPQLEPGEGVSAEAAATFGRSILKTTPNAADVAATAFAKDNSVSFEGFAAARAKAEEAFARARKVESEHGTDSAEYRTASAEGAKWDKITKDMQTEWHKLGQAQQGHTDLDTGSFTGLQRAWMESTGREFTPKQAEQAQRIAKESSEVQARAKAAVQKTVQTIEAGIDKAGDDVKRVWTHIKTNYLAKGITDFDDIIHGTATDLGMSANDVRRALTKPKSARVVTNEMYKAMADRRKVIQTAKAWLKDQEIPGWLKALRIIPRIFFVDKIFGHGTVGMVTHAGLNIFNPGAWKTYWPEFFRQFPLVFSKGYHERVMQDLVRDPNYITARRAGLVNEPDRYADDYQNAAMKTFMGKFAGLIGGRGFDALKTFRQKRFNQIWNSYTPEMKTQEMAKLIADSVNHATGVVKMPFREWTGWTFFAPKLEGSRWAWMVGDPAKAGKIIGSWSTATPAERAFAIRQVKEKAAISATYFALLEMNQGMLKAAGSNQSINMTDPRKSDFLAFKALGHNIGLVGPMLGMVRLFAGLIHDSVGQRGKLERLTSRGKEMAEDLGQYGRGKLSPFAGQVVNVAAQSDYQGRPLPFSDEKAPAYLRKRGEDTYTWGEYAAQELAPIPVEEALKEVWSDHGMDEKTIGKYLKALAVGVAAGGTGVRISTDYDAQ